MKQVHLGNKHAAGHAPQGISYSYDNLIPKIIERTAYGEYPHTKMAREMGIKLEVDMPLRGR